MSEFEVSDEVVQVYAAAHECHLSDVTPTDPGLTKVGALLETITRAAQVQVLRETADELEPKRAYNGTGYTPWNVLRAKADELEAGR